MTLDQDFHLQEDLLTVLDRDFRRQEDRLTVWDRDFRRQKGRQMALNQVSRHRQEDRLTVLDRDFDYNNFNLYSRDIQKSLTSNGGNFNDVSYSKLRICVHNEGSKIVYSMETSNI